MAVKIVNEDILDEKEPIIYVQRYLYSKRAYLIFRRPYTPGEDFVISAESENFHRDVSTWMTEYDSDDDLDEVFAMVYLDEEYPPKAEEYPDAAFIVEYDVDTKLYEFGVGQSGMNRVSTLQEAIEQGIAILDELISTENF